MGIGGGWHAREQGGAGLWGPGHCIAGYLLWVDMGHIHASEWLRKLWRTKGVWLSISSINVSGVFLVPDLNFTLNYHPQSHRHLPAVKDPP